MSSSSTNTLGRYQIVREIARSNDIVYEAVDPSINRRIALKELSIPPNLQGAQRRERIERFWREGKAAGRLNHPNIVTIYEVGQDGDRYFIAMEYLDGQSLRDLLQAGGPLNIQDAVEYTIQLCSALSYAHKNGVIHRDIKPENVQILPGNHIKITDFGIARLIGEPSITQDGQVFGTPSYMSPEQVTGKQIDHRSDIFSLGVVLYEMIAGKKPFTGDGIVTITYNIMHMDPPQIPGAPPYIMSVIRKAMSKEPDFRYSSADELMYDLQTKLTLQNQIADDPFVGVYDSQPYFNTSSINKGPMTPYGTSLPSQQAGALPPQMQDPFASQQAPTNSASIPSVPKEPMLSAETRNFLGVLFLVLALAGAVIFALWAVNKAYQGFKIATSSRAAANYLQQGDYLYDRGEIEKAVDQWQNAIRVSSDSEQAKAAKERLFKVSIEGARKSVNNKNIGDLQRFSDFLISTYPDRPEGHFYKGIYFHVLGKLEDAKDEYQKAVDFGGNDAYAIKARNALEKLTSKENYVPYPPELDKPKIEVQSQTENSQSFQKPNNVSPEIPFIPAPQ